MSPARACKICSARIASLSAFTGRTKLSFDCRCSSLDRNGKKENHPRELQLSRARLAGRYHFSNYDTDMIDFLFHVFMSVESFEALSPFVLASHPSDYFDSLRPVNEFARPL
jgi:hypothetical protein